MRPATSLDSINTAPAVPVGAGAADLHAGRRHGGAADRRHGGGTARQLALGGAAVAVTLTVGSLVGGHLA